MMRIKEGFKGERLVSLPEELLESYRKEPLIGNLYVRKIGFFPRVRYHFVQKERGCDYAMLIYCTEGKGWYSILGKRYAIERNHYVIIPPNLPYSFGADEADPWTIYWLHFRGKLCERFLPAHPMPVALLPNEHSRLQDRLRLFEEIFGSFAMGYIKEYMIYASMCLHLVLASFVYVEQFRRFAELIEPHGCLIYYEGDENLRRIAEGAAMIRTKGEPGTGNVIEAVRHCRQVLDDIRRLCCLPEDEVANYAKEIGAPLEVCMLVRKEGRLPVVNFAAGGIATPADAAMMMQLGCDGVFVGSGIFKSGDPAKRAKAIVQAVTNYNDYKLLAEISKDLGEPMVGIDISTIPAAERMQERGW